MRRGRILQFEREDCVIQLFRIGIPLFMATYLFLIVREIIEPRQQ
ncbi:hypothetical protein PCC7424_0073 [Gloeothece citriformis PCC 7424]|uniref:Uncharacterized protein n=1 Tax=Gloeothece citriformis (strain PCC 7424) TaxID=65393 RepID=B7K857_GLOC7|nr:hypothetical protein PCC7424_0073 [Gloeothece citriformis PCC 7424]